MLYFYILMPNKKLTHLVLLCNFLLFCCRILFIFAGLSLQGNTIAKLYKLSTTLPYKCPSTAPLGTVSPTHSTERFDFDTSKYFEIYSTEWIIYVIIKMRKIVRLNERRLKKIIRNNKMKDLKFIGIGGAYALGLGGNCAYLKDGKTLLLIDCCEDATSKLKENNAFCYVAEIVIAITHTHADHCAGLGTFIWYSNFILNIKPQIISNSDTFEEHLRELLKLLGVEEKFFEFVNSANVVVDNCKIEMLPTTHTKILESFGIMFADNEGKYYYTGDTNDF